MMRPLRIGLVGDFDETVTAHRAIPVALELAARKLAHQVSSEWVPTDRIEDAADLGRFDGLWCVPASPYRSTDGALRAIRFARERRCPLLGTCGGFQHVIVEYARHVLGWTDAEHAETAPASNCPVIAPLSCELLEATGLVRFRPGTRIAAAYGRGESSEGYRCRYGLNPRFRSTFEVGPLRIGALDETGDVRSVELEGHPFFVATLFQPERAALRGEAPPLVVAFVRSAQACRGA